MEKRNYSNEINSELNCKIYYKPEPHIVEIDLVQYYKIKRAYLDSKYKLLQIFTNDIIPPLLAKEVCKYICENYHYPDSLIYKELVPLITSAMPDLDSKKYIDNIQKYVNDL